jgi:hypothetical protein
MWQAWFQICLKSSGLVICELLSQRKNLTTFLTTLYVILSKILVELFYLHTRFVAGGRGEGGEGRGVQRGGSVCKLLEAERGSNSHHDKYVLQCSVDKLTLTFAAETGTW